MDLTVTKKLKKACKLWLISAAGMYLFVVISEWILYIVTVCGTGPATETLYPGGLAGGGQQWFRAQMLYHSLGRICLLYISNFISHGWMLAQRQPLATHLFIMYMWNIHMSIND